MKTVDFLSESTEITRTPAPVLMRIAEIPYENLVEISADDSTNLFASGHMVDSLTYMLDSEAQASCAELEKVYIATCCENDAMEAETHFPESREVYLGLFGLLYRERPAEFMPPNSQHCEHDMAEWFLKRRQAYRPSWGGIQER